MRRTLPALLIAVIVLAAAGWTIAWYHFANGMRGRVDAWIAARRAEGVQADYERLSVDGFPFAWHVRISHPNMTGAGPTSWTWQGYAVSADLAPWSLREIPLHFPGDQRFSAGAGTVAETWTVSAARPDGQVGLDERGRLDHLAFDLGDVTLLRATDVQPAHADHLTGRVQLHRGSDDHQADTFDLALTLDNATLARAPVPLLGPQIAHAELGLAFKGRLPSGTLAPAVAAWRDDGGTIEINRIAVKWGPVDADGNGTLALDAQNRLLGAFTARWRGYNEALDVLTGLGQIRPLQAAAAKIALNSLARANQSGVSEVNIPLTAQDGRLFVAGFPLMPLPGLKFE